MLLDQVIDFYHETLKSSPEALAYLDRRVLGKLELIERFKLGFANRTLEYRLAPKQYKAAAERRSALQRVRILRERGHEHFNCSIVIPLSAVYRRLGSAAVAHAGEQPHPCPPFALASASRMQHALESDSAGPPQQLPGLPRSSTADSFALGSHGGVVFNRLSSTITAFLLLRRIHPSSLHFERRSLPAMDARTTKKTKAGDG
jgi:hypothetical protein